MADDREAIVPSKVAARHAVAEVKQEAPRAEATLFSQSDQLNSDSTDALAIRHGISDDDAGWDRCLAGDLQAALFDELYPYLWPFARSGGQHVDPLHEQLIKKRNIVAAENPRLHLTWFHDTLYVKPLPDYLLSHAVWDRHVQRPRPQALDARPRYDKYRAAAGFVRSYGLLVRHESDFAVARRCNLLPEYVTFHGFQRFVRGFRELDDGDVSHRYQYGQFRLSRLNWVANGVKLVRPLARMAHDPGHRRLPWYYQRTHWELRRHIQEYAAPFIFVFAVLSLILGSMQVVLAALGPDTWEGFVRVSWGFSVATIVFAASPVVMIVLLGSMVSLAQFAYAVRSRWRERPARNDD